MEDNFRGNIDDITGKIENIFRGNLMIILGKI